MIRAYPSVRSHIAAALMMIASGLFAAGCGLPPDGGEPALAAQAAETPPDPQASVPPAGGDGARPPAEGTSSTARCFPRKCTATCCFDTSLCKWHCYE